MNRKYHLFFGLAAVLAILGWMYVGQRRAPDVAATPRTGQASGFGNPDSPPGASLDSRLAQLREAATEGEMRADLSALRASLESLPPDRAIGWIRDYLASGEDWQTGLGFQIGPNQELTGWPSVRCFLLDCALGLDPAGAAGIARDILAVRTHPDEWAVAMRNLGMAADLEQDGALLRRKAAELLRDEEWAKDPTMGYLQAFDVMVHTRQTDLTAEFVARTNDRDNMAVRHASYLVLDRLTMVDPGNMLAKLADEANKNPGSALMISNMMARADVRDGTQRSTLESYLLDPARSVEEVRAFAAIFPNANLMLSNNLLTRTEASSGSEQAAKDRATLEVVNEWLLDARFANLQDALIDLRDRLSQFVKP